MENRDRATAEQGRVVAEERWQLLERISAWLDQPMAVLALLWVALLVVDFTGVLPPSLRMQFAWLDGAIWIAFLVEFLLELVIAPDKLSYIRRHWITALSVLLPFFRVVRLVRTFRAIRSLSLLRILLGANRATRAAARFLGRHGFQYVLAVVAIATVAGAAGVYAAERSEVGTRFDSFGTALWWSATMITTINVGIEPVTFEGRMIALLLRVLALALFGYIAGSVASYFVRSGTESPEEEGETEQSKLTMSRDVRELRRQVSLLTKSIEEMRRQMNGRDPK